MMSDADLQEALVEADAAFVKMASERHAMGEEKYGSQAFLAADTFEMALEELADLANYARYTFAKVYMLRIHVAQQMAPEGPPQMGMSAVQNSLGG